MKFGLSLLVCVVAFCAIVAEAKPGRVKCSVGCWERLPACKDQCKITRMATRACNANCQEKVAECIREECDVPENVDTYEQHQKYD